MLNRDETILLVEDDRVDIMTVQRALRKNEIGNALQIARTGLEALNMLRGEGGFDKISPPPGLILLDLKQIRVANLLPALAIAPAIVALLQALDVAL